MFYDAAFLILPPSHSIKTGLLVAVVSVHSAKVGVPLNLVHAKGSKVQKDANLPRQLLYKK